MTTELITEYDGHFDVRRRAYWDPEVFRAEHERIFKKSWLFLAHESEIPEAGDYVLRRLGVDPVIVCRDEDGTIRVLANTCRHRGVALCRADRGNASHFRCPYHGWTFANTGKLIGVTFMSEVYGRDFDKSRFGLYQPPHVDSFMGLIFACWDPDAPSLRDYLGSACWYLESMLGKWDDGIEVIGSPIRTIAATNWKPETENVGGDGYHTQITHQSGVKLGMFASKEMLEALGEVGSKPYVGRVVVCENGHTFRVHQMGITPPRPSFFGYPEEMWPEIERNLTSSQITAQSRLSIMHGNIFPNLTVMENFKTSTEKAGSACRFLRFTLQYPLAPDRNEMLWWGFVPRNSPPEWRSTSQNANLRTSAPAGMFQVDDIENYVSLTGSSHPGSVVIDEPISYEAGMHNEIDATVDWPGTVYAADKSEQTQRAFWRRWGELLGDGVSTNGNQPRARGVATAPARS
jgi:nitrite reductase/ring-hydroxylating ferredoxin subunit